MAIRQNKEKIRSQAAHILVRTDGAEKPLLTFHATATRERTRSAPGYAVRLAQRVNRLFGRDCFISLTDRHVIVHRLGGTLIPEVGEQYWTLPRETRGSPVSDVRIGGRFHSRLRLALPGQGATLYCTVERYWRSELERFVAELEREWVTPLR